MTEIPLTVLLSSEDERFLVDPFFSLLEPELDSSPSSGARAERLNAAPELAPREPPEVTAPLARTSLRSFMEGKRIRLKRPFLPGAAGGVGICPGGTVVGVGGGSSSRDRL